MAIGCGFGWMPAAILGCIAGFLWPLAVLGGIILLIAGEVSETQAGDLKPPLCRRLQVGRHSN
jgi:hypothetical protein